MLARAVRSCGWLNGRQCLDGLPASSPSVCHPLVRFEDVPMFLCPVIGLLASVDVKQQSLSLSLEDVPLVEFMHLVFTRVPGESYRRPLRSLLLYLCYVFDTQGSYLVLEIRNTSTPPKT